MDKKKLALIHVVKKELNLSDEAYRNILQQTTGVSSAKDLDEAKFKKLMKVFVRSPYYRINRDGLTLRQKMLLESLGRDLHWDEKHLNNFVKKYYHKPSVNVLSRREARKAIESLKHIHARQIQAEKGDQQHGDKS